MRDLISDEQQMFADAVTRFAASEYGFGPAPHGKAFDRARLRRAGELGCLSFAVPEDHGGFGGPVEAMVAMMALAPALPPEPIVESGIHAASLLAAAAPPETAAAVLPGIAAGDAVAAVADLEASARYDRNRIATEARRSGSSFTLDGRKPNVLFAAEADWLVVSALLDGEPSLFLVRGGAAGLSMAPCARIDGRPAADVVLAGVAAQARLDAAPAAAALEHATCVATAAGIAEMVGLMDALVAATVDYARMRRQFGTAIGTFQALQHRIADMWIACEEARSVAAMAAYGCLAGGEEGARAVPSAMLTACDAAARVGNEAIQIHGAIGMTDELVVSHWYRRLWALRQGLGDRRSHLARLVA